MTLHIDVSKKLYVVCQTYMHVRVRILVFHAFTRSISSSSRRVFPGSSYGETENSPRDRRDCFCFYFATHSNPADTL